MVLKKRLLNILFFSLLFLSVSSITRANILVLQPTDGKDAEIVAGSHINSNYGSFSYLITNWGGHTENKGLIEFDLSSLAGAHIDTAVLSLYHLYNNVYGAQYGIHRVLSSWEENTVTWNNAPNIDSTASTVISINDNNVGLFRDFDITSLVQGWVSGAYPNYGMEIIQERSSFSGTWLYFTSSDYLDTTKAPKLLIEYNSGSTTVPEPATIALLSMSMFGAGLIRLKRREA